MNSEIITTFVLDYIDCDNHVAWFITPDKSRTLDIPNILEDGINKFIIDDSVVELQLFGEYDTHSEIFIKNNKECVYLTLIPTDLGLEFDVITILSLNKL